MTEKSYQGPVFALIIFLIVGSALAGTPGAEPETNYIEINQECHQWKPQGEIDEDNDGTVDIREDPECLNFPYENGNGESTTPVNSYDVNLDYQPYFDLTVDYIRTLINYQCGGNLAGCIGTNYANEVQFYCDFDNNFMMTTWASTFDKFFNLWHPNMANDGSLNLLFSTCNGGFPGQPGPSTLPVLEYQASSPIADNPSGSGGGK